MTWGKLRFLLLQEKGDKPTLDQLDSWLNSRYEQVLEATDWTGARARATLLTQPAHESAADSITLTVGSGTVVGSGVTWDDSIVGLKLYRTGDTPIYTVSERIDAHTVNLDRPYEGNGQNAPGTVYASAPYVLMQNVYPLPADCRAIVELLDPATNLPLRQLRQADMDASVGARTLVDSPAVFAVVEDSPEASGNVVHQVEFYPPPRFGRGYPIEYLRAAFEFDGGNLDDSPLPFVSETILQYGCKADLAAWQGNMPRAQVFEAKYQEELRRLLMVEHAQRRPAPKLKMDERFTRHRLARAGRGYNNFWGPGAGKSF